MAPGVEGAALLGVGGPGVAGADLAPGVAGPGVAGADEAPGVVGACFGVGSLPALNPSRCFQSALYMEFLFFFFLQYPELVILHQYTLQPMPSTPRNSLDLAGSAFCGKFLLRQTVRNILLRCFSLGTLAVNIRKRLRPPPLRQFPRAPASVLLLFDSLPRGALQLRLAVPLSSSQ